MNRATFRVWAFLLLAAGAGIWKWVELRAEVEGLQTAGLGTLRWWVAGAAVAASLLPPFTRRVNAALDVARHPTRRNRERLTLAIALACATYFVATAMIQDRDLFPKTHDEGSYRLQMQMLAGGRLWMPRHPMADFFDTFYVITSPVYASQYFPGTAMLYVPSVWLGWPTWVLPALASGAVVGLVYRITTELVDGAAGLLAALLMVSLSWFRMLSVLLYSQVPMLLLGLLAVWAWLRWREEGRPLRRAAWLVAVGAFCGWGAITRPVDALCFALPVGAGIVCDLWRGPARRWWALAGVVVGATPFLVLQLVVNRGVTGDPLKTPFRMYLDRDFPGTRYGFPADDPAARPASHLAQKQDLYASWVRPYLRRHRPEAVAASWVNRWLPMAAGVVLPVRVLLVFVPLGLAAAVSSRRTVFLAVLPLFILLYVPNPFVLEHYFVLVAPAFILLVLLGANVLERALPVASAQVRAAFAVLLVAVSLFSVHELNPRVDDETFRSPMLRFVNDELPHLVQKPAVVLFRYAPGSPMSEVVQEPVYNSSVAWPDDAPVVRAHDLGDRNVEIFRYYARRQPDRTFYLFDRATRTLSPPLGTARALAATQPADGP